MATQQPDPQRQEILDEYRVWARICEDKHGLPWPVSDDLLPDTDTSKLLLEIKKLKMLGRTPHE